MKTKRILSGLIGAIMAITATISMFSATVTVTAEDAQNDIAPFIDLDQESITAAMGAGWNLGNQLEATDSNGTPREDAWNNPVIKKELLHAIKLAGFKTVRIPISYLTKIGPAPYYKIDANWLARIKNVVDYAIDEGLYVVMNMHGDGYNSVKGGWLLCNAPDEQQPAIKAKYAACWKQIAEMFTDYDEHLIFESMNEEFNGIYGKSPVRSQYQNINDYNQIFIDTVRQTGGNNAKRWLLICGWNTDINYTVSDYGFAFPTDEYLDKSITENRIMLSVHFYEPWDFCGDDTSGTYSQWGKDSDPKRSAGYANSEDNMDKQLQKVYRKFVQAGYPVIVGEYGCINKSAYDPLNTKFRAYYCKTFCEYAKQYGCVPVYWDNGGIHNSFGLINRTTMKIEMPEIVDAIVNVYNGVMEKLSLAIKEAEEIDSNLYMPDSWAEFMSVLNAAKQVYNTSGLEDDAYLAAVDSIYEAIEKLVPNPEVLKEVKILTEQQNSSWENEDSEKLIISYTNESVDFSKLVQFKVTFFSYDDVTDDTIAFIFKPFSNVNWSGWDPVVLYVKDCVEEDGMYTGYIDAQAVLAAYSGNQPEANGVNLYYGTEEQELVLTSFSAMIAQGDRHVHDYEVVNRVANTCTSFGKCDFKCSEDEETASVDLNYAAHSYLASTKVAATCTEEGIKLETCRNCGHAVESPIPAKGHKFENGVCKTCGEPDPEYVPPVTGPTTDPTKPSVNPTKPSTKPTTDKVAAAKKAAQQAMKQAKITSLKAKAKGKKKIKVSWKKVNKATGYEIEVAPTQKFNKKVIKKSTTKNNIVIKKLKSKKTYFVRVRAYATYKDAKGKTQKVTSAWIKKVRKVKVK